MSKTESKITNFIGTVHKILYKSDVAFGFAFNSVNET